MTPLLTLVDVLDEPGYYRYTLLFGDGRRARTCVDTPGCRRDLVAFEPHERFAYLRLATFERRAELYVCRALEAGGAGRSVPGVRPIVEVLLETRGKVRVQEAVRVLEAWGPKASDADVRRLHLALQTTRRASDVAALLEAP